MVIHTVLDSHHGHSFLQDLHLAIFDGDRLWYSLLLPKLNGRLGVDHHHPGTFSDGTDYSFCNGIIMLRVWRTRLARRTLGHTEKLDGCSVIFAPSLIEQESVDLVYHRVYLGLK